MVLFDCSFSPVIRGFLLIGILVFFMGSLSATDYYVDVVNGNDGNNGLTMGTAFKTFLPVASPTQANPGILLPGDVVYIMNGTYTQTYNHGDSDFAGSSIAYFRADATAANPITIKPYPGEKPIFDGLNSNLALGIRGDGYDVSGFEIRNTRTAAVFIRGARDVKIHDMNIHDTGGDGGSNHGSLTIQDSSYNIEIYNSIFKDVYNYAGPSSNNVHIVIFSSNAGGNISIYNNSFIQGTGDGACLRNKHGSLDPGTFTEIYDNYFEGCDHYAYEGAAINTFFHNNILYMGRGIKIDAPGGPGIGVNQYYYNNTFYDVPGYILDNRNIGFGSPENLTFRNNIIVRNASTYYGAPVLGMVDVVRYASDATYYLALPAMDIDNNCYYNPDQAVQFAFASNAAAGSTGGSYNFAQWQALEGMNYDANSLVEDPLFVDVAGGDFRLLPGSNCTNMGAYALSSPTNECDNWQINHPEWLFCDDFENGFSSNWRYLDAQATIIENAQSYIGNSTKVTAHLSGGDSDFIFNVSPREDKVHVRYYIKFDPLTDWPKHMGGIVAKFPTYCPGGGCAGIVPPADQAFWSSLEPNKEQIGLLGGVYWDLYTYWHEMSCGGGCWGDHFIANQTDLGPIQKDQWYCIEAMMKVNTPNQYDGVQAFWVDDVLIGNYSLGNPTGNWAGDNYFDWGPYYNPGSALPFEGYNWRNVSSLKISQIELQWYHDTTQSSTDVVYYDNVVVSTDYIGCVGASPPQQPPTCHDVNSDNRVNIFDVALVLANQGNSGLEYSHLDIDTSGVVDLGDVISVIGDFGKVC